MTERHPNKKSTSRRASLPAVLTHLKEAGITTLQNIIEPLSTGYLGLTQARTAHHLTQTEKDINALLLKQVGKVIGYFYPLLESGAQNDLKSIPHQLVATLPGGRNVAVIADLYEQRYYATLYADPASTPKDEALPGDKELVEMMQSHAKRYDKKPTGTCVRIEAIWPNPYQKGKKDNTPTFQALYDDGKYGYVDIADMEKKNGTTFQLAAVIDE